MGAAQTDSQKDVAIIMGSKSDLPTMRGSIDACKRLGLSYRVFIVSAHRTPDWMVEFAKKAKSQGYKVIIAGAGGSAHLPGMTAANTILPTIGVPVGSSSHPQNDQAAFLSMSQMPAGIPLAVMPLGARESTLEKPSAGAWNAGLLAASILGLYDPELQKRLEDFRQQQTEGVLKDVFVEEG